jgi:hypothetical protein
MADFFEHHPSSPDELVGIAGELVRDARNAHAAVTDVQHGIGWATTAVDGDLTIPMEKSSHPVANLGTNAPIEQIYQPLEDPERFPTPGHLHHTP